MPSLVVTLLRLSRQVVCLASLPPVTLRLWYVRKGTFLFMWEFFEELYTDPKTIKKITMNRFGVRREDGFSILGLVTYVEDKSNVFLCRGDFGEFRFMANRWNSRENKPSDTYIVYTNLLASDSGMNRDTHRKLILDFAKDIESALLAFPIYKSYNDLPVRKVLFNISTDPENQVLISAEEI